VHVEQHNDSNKNASSFSNKCHEFETRVSADPHTRFVKTGLMCMTMAVLVVIHINLKQNIRNQPPCSKFHATSEDLSCDTDPLLSYKKQQSCTNLLLSNVYEGLLPWG